MSDKDINEKCDSLYKYFSYQQVFLQLANVCSSLVSVLINFVDIDNDPENFDKDSDMISKFFATVLLDMQNVEYILGIKEQVKKEFDGLQEKRN